MRPGLLAACATLVWAGVAYAWVEDTELSGLDVLFLGEVHDNPVHHELQTDAVQAIRPKALVFEMLTPAQASLINAYEVLPEADTLAEALAWSESGWPDFAFYAPIIAAGIAGGARVYGTTLPRDSLMMAMQGDLAGAFGDEATRYGLDRPLDAPELDARLALQLRAHCDALPAEMLPGMVAVQRLRDAHIARTARDALRETGGPVAVITGSGHARTDWGAPALLARAAPEVRLLSVGHVEEGAGNDAPPFDLLVTTAPAVRDEDPCAALR